MLKKAVPSHHTRLGKMIVLFVTAMSTIFILSIDNKVLALDNTAVTQPGYLLTVNVPSHPFGTSTIGISITTENGYVDQANIPTAGNPSWTFNIPANQGNSVQVCVNSGALSEENCHLYKTTGSAMSVSLPAVSGNNSSGTGNNSSNDNNNSNKNNNSHHHDSGTTNKSNDNNHSSSHHNSNTNSNSGVENNRSNRHESGGFNDQGDRFNGRSDTGSNAHQGNDHGFSGSSNNNPGSNDHRNSSNSKTNNAGVPMIQFIGPIQ